MSQDVALKTKYVYWEGPEPDPFYGFRYHHATLPDGTEVVTQLPLTYEELLDPREEDEILENNQHERECGDMARILRARFPSEQGYHVFSDMKIEWDLPNMRCHAPDVALFADVTVTLPKLFGTYRVADYGGRPVLLVEIVSPVGERRHIDWEEKLKDYQQVGVEYYVIVDHEKDGTRRVYGFHQTEAGFLSLPEDDQGRVFVEPIGLLLGTEDDDLKYYDAETGQEIGDYTWVTKKWEAEAEARQREVKARRKEAKARKLAEEAQKRAEDRVRVLEEQLRNLHHGKNGGAENGGGATG